MLSGIKRTVQLGLLAKDMATVRWRREGTAADEARQQVVERLAGLHGLPQKIGQLMTLAQLDGPSAYLPLTEGRATCPAEEAFALLESSLGRPWTDCFRSLDREGIAASLGQVHRGVLHDGRTVAVKIQFPDSATNVATDLTALGWLTMPFGSLHRGFDLTAYQRAIGDMLGQELDYRREAQTLQHFSKLARECPGIVVPEVIAEYSTDRVLTMTWIEGESLTRVLDWPLDERRQVAELLLRLFLTSSFRWHCLHADPNPGNYRFSRTSNGVQIGLVDFGCVLSLDEGLGTITDLIASARDEKSPVLERYIALGFNADLLEPMAHLLPGLTRILFEPFITEGPFDVAAWNMANRVEELLGPFRWNFRFAGPASLIFLVRAYLGLIRYQAAVGAPIDWARTWREIVCDKMNARQDQEKVSKPRTGQSPLSLARHLRVRVQEAGRTRVELTFKATAAEYLADLIPPELEQKLQERSVDIHKIAADAVANRFAPGELFQLSEGNKVVRVWLE